jgi:hypothetical protein
MNQRIVVFVQAYIYTTLHVVHVMEQIHNLSIHCCIQFVLRDEPTSVTR